MTRLIRSNASFKDEDMAAITDWSDQDSGTSGAASTQETFDGASCMKLFSGTSASENDFAKRTIDVGTFSSTVTVNLRLYGSALGTSNGTESDCAELMARKNDVALWVRFGSNGLFIFDGANFNEVGSDLVVQGAWQEWLFVCDFTTAASATVDVYLTDANHTDTTLVGDGIDCSYTGSFTNGDTRLYQHGDNVASRLSYVDWIKVGNGLLYTVSIGSGALAVAGTATGIRAQRKIPTASGVLTVDGTALVLTIPKKIRISPGAFSITGSRLILSSTRLDFSTKKIMVADNQAYIGAGRNPGQIHLRDATTTIRVKEQRRIHVTKAD